MMRTMKRKGAVILLLFAAMVLLATNQALAQHGCNTGGGGMWLDQFVNPNASGAKVTGTLTLYYNPVGVGGSCLDGGSGVWEDFVYVFRVITTSEQSPYHGQYMPFSGIKRVDMSLLKNVCFDDMDSQAGIIQNFIGTKIVPTLFPSSTRWAIKSYTFVQPPDLNPDGCCNAMEWMMLDFTLAVK